MRRGVAVVALVGLAGCASTDGDLAGAEPPPAGGDVVESAALVDGRRLALARDWEAAIACLTDAVDAAVGEAASWEALRWRGHAFTGAERHAEALDDLTRALAIDDGDAWTRYAHSMALHNLGRLAEARRGYSMALELDPNFDKARQWRGYTASLMGEPIEALRDLDVSLGLDPHQPWLRAIRAKVLVELRQFDAAEVDFWAAFDGDPRNADLAAQIGFLAGARGSSEEMERMLAHAVALDGEGQPDARLWLARARLLAGDRAGGEELLREPFAEAWHGAVARTLLCAFSVEELVARAARLDAEGASPEFACEAWFYAAAIQAPGCEGVAEAYAHCLATRAEQKWEWLAAQRALVDAVLGSAGR